MSDTSFDPEDNQTDSDSADELDSDNEEDIYVSSAIICSHNHFPPN